MPFPSAVSNAARSSNERLSAVVHDLRSPLASIVGYAEILQSGDVGALTEQQTSMLKVVERNALRILELSEQLVGEAKHVEERVELWDLFEGIARSLLPVAADAGVSIAIDIEDGLTEIVGDSAGLERAILNLMNNAIKFSPSGARVDVSIMRFGDRVRVSVSDKGIGIPFEDQENVFKPFHRASNAGRIEGTGLGLSIVKEIARSHDGYVSLFLLPNSGTTVIIDLPG